MMGGDGDDDGRGVRRGGLKWWCRLVGEPPPPKRQKKTHLARRRDARHELLDRLRRAPHEPRRERRLGLGGDEDRREPARGQQAPHGGGALDVEPQHDVGAARERRLDLVQGNALVLAIDDGVLQQAALLDPGFELGARDEKVVAAVLLAGARRAGGQAGSLRLFWGEGGGVC